MLCSDAPKTLSTAQLEDVATRCRRQCLTMVSPFCALGDLEALRSTPARPSNNVLALCLDRSRRLKHTETLLANADNSTYTDAQIANPPRTIDSHIEASSSSHRYRSHRPMDVRDDYTPSKVRLPALPLQPIAVRTIIITGAPGWGTSPSGYDSPNDASMNEQCLKA